MASQFDRWSINFVNKIQAKLFFRRLGTEAATRGVKIAAKAGIQPIFMDIRRRIPERTGKLKGALKLRIVAKRGNAKAIVGFTKKGSHAVFQEFGTRHHAPQPFMRPAVEAKGGQAARIVFAVYLKFIRRLARRGIR